MISVRRLATLFILLVSSIWAANSSRAALLIDIVGGTEQHFVGGPATAGYAFSVSSPLLVNGLGYFDIGANGLADTHPVALWTSGGVLLTTTTITTASPLVASASAAGDWRMNTIAPLLLVPGTYVVGGQFSAPDTDGDIFDATTLILAPGVSFIEDRSSGAGSGLSFPTVSSPFTGNSFFGPAVFVTAAAVPEPNGLILVATALLFAAMVASRRLMGRRGRSSGAGAQCA